jgi:predicted PurR-regulated permease PerM
MQNSHNRSSGVNVLFSAGAFVIVVAGMRASESLLVPFLIAVVVAVICMPSLSWMQKKGVPSVLAILIVVVGITLIGTVVTVLVGTSLDDFSRDLPVYQANLKSKAQMFITWFQQTGVTVPEEKILEMLNPGAAMNLAAKLLTKLGSVFTNAFLILLTVIFILLEASSLSSKLRTISKTSGPSNSHFDSFIQKINRYMAIKTATSLLTGVCVGVWLAVLAVVGPARLFA